MKVEADNACVFVRDFQGDMEVAFTSGNIMMEQMVGRVTLRSSRGNITVRENSGVVSVVGNYGALILQDVSGETAISTIMRNAVFDALIQAGDTVRLSHIGTHACESIEHVGIMTASASYSQSAPIWQLARVIII